MKKHHRPGRKRLRRQEPPSAPGSQVAPPASAQALLAPLAVEVWRLGRRIAAAPGTSERFADSHARLVRALEDAGVRTDDPLGTRFVEGTSAQIIDMPDGADPALESVIVTDVLRPAVYVDGICIVTPQVILGRSNDDGGTNDTNQH